MKRLSLLMCALIAILSCGKSNEPSILDADYSDVDTISFDYTDCKIIPRDSVFGKISYVKLETNDDNLIGMTDQIILGDSTIIVADYRIAKGVFMFDYDGNYLGRISRLGNGRNEYLALIYVCKRPDKTIAIFDDIKKQIMYFSERGEFKGSIYCDLFSHGVGYITNDIMAFAIHGRYPDHYEYYGHRSFVVMNDKMNIQYLFGKNEQSSSFSYRRYFHIYSYDDKVYCGVDFKDYIFELGTDGVKAKYMIDYGPENVIHYPFETKEQYYELQEQYPYFEGEFVELADYTYLNYRGNNGSQLIYKHSTKETFALTLGYDNPLLSFFQLPIARMNDNTMVCSTWASTMLFYKDVLMNVSDKSKLEVVKDLYENIEADSNPVLFFYEVKF